MLDMCGTRNLDDMEEQDSYSIYDNIVRKALPKYIKAFGLKDRSIKNTLTIMITSCVHPMVRV